MCLSFHPSRFCDFCSTFWSKSSRKSFGTIPPLKACLTYLWQYGFQSDRTVCYCASFLQDISGNMDNSVMLRFYSYFGFVYLHYGALISMICFSFVHVLETLNTLCYLLHIAFAFTSPLVWKLQWCVQAFCSYQNKLTFKLNETIVMTIITISQMTFSTKNQRKEIRFLKLIRFEHSGSFNIL